MLPLRSGGLRIHLQIGQRVSDEGLPIPSNPGATYAGIPPQFAYPAAFGDLLAALLALISILALVRNAASARLLVWIFNGEGTLDLFNAITVVTI
jgi:hypothetical protein